MSQDYGLCYPTEFFPFDRCPLFRHSCCIPGVVSVYLIPLHSLCLQSLSNFICSELIKRVILLENKSLSLLALENQVVVLLRPVMLSALLYCPVFGQTSQLHRWSNVRLATETWGREAEAVAASRTKGLMLNSLWQIVQR